MAESPKKSVGSKRIVKNPETFRERAIKAADEGEKPTQRALISGSVKQTTDPIKNAAKSFANIPIFKPLRTPLRILGKILIPAYFRNSWKELKQVSWPGMKESIRLTYAVLIFAVVFGVSVAIVDYGLDSVFKRILLK